MSNYRVIPKGINTIDYASHELDLRYVASQGYIGGASYIMGTLSTPGVNYGKWPTSKIVTPERLQHILATLGAFMPIWERGKDEFLGGYQAGQRAAAAANGDLDILKYPKSRHVIVAYDIDVTRGNLAQAADYWRGWKAESAWQKLIPYGDDDIFQVIDRDLGGADYYWQAGAMAWSGRKVSPLATMLQLYGYLLDPRGYHADRNLTLKPFEMWTGQPDPEPVKDIPDMTPTVYSVHGSNAAFFQVPNEQAGDPTIHVQWSGPGSDPKVKRLLAGLLASETRQVTVDPVACAAWTLHGPVPTGDKRTWSAADFYRVV